MRSSLESHCDMSVNVVHARPQGEENICTDEENSTSTFFTRMEESRDLARRHSLSSPPTRTTIEPTTTETTPGDVNEQEERPYLEEHRNDKDFVSTNRAAFQESPSHSNHPPPSFYECNIW